jgi:hypothetical protein
MNLIPFNLFQDCPVCGDARDKVLHACSSECLRADTEQFINGTTHDSPVSPHVHCRCVTCGFTWLMEPRDLREARRLW